MEKAQVHDAQLDQESEHLVHDVDALPNEYSAKQTGRYILVVYVLLVLLGIGTGYILARDGGAKVLRSQGIVDNNKVAGITDERTFKDSAEGTIEAGGLNGEGTHKLLREGGSSQTVYLTSSAVDLDAYVGKKVKVWGQTMAAEKAAWLMDVGKLEVLE